MLTCHLKSAVAITTANHAASSATLRDVYQADKFSTAPLSHIKTRGAYYLNKCVHSMFEHKNTRSQICNLSTLIYLFELNPSGKIFCHYCFFFYQSPLNSLIVVASQLTIFSYNLFFIVLWERGFKKCSGVSNSFSMLGYVRPRKTIKTQSLHDFFINHAACHCYNIVYKVKKTNYYPLFTATRKIFHIWYIVLINIYIWKQMGSFNFY